MKIFLIISVVFFSTLNLKAQTFKIVNSYMKFEEREDEPLPGTKGGSVTIRDSRTILYGETFHHVYTHVSSPRFLENSKMIGIFWYATDEDGVKCKLGLSSTGEISIFGITYKSVEYTNIIDNYCSFEDTKYRVIDYLRSYK